MRRSISSFAVVLHLFFHLLSLPASAQDTTKTDNGERVSALQGSVDGINETLAEIKNSVDALKKIKISGYIQAQFQSTNGIGPISSSDPSNGKFAGGDFPANSSSRFLLRRGRLKVNYDNDLTQYVLQIDVVPSGLSIKDAFASIREPWARTAVLTAGVFDRPFGFEISYSSGSREAPERTRMFQTLFPGEREVGAKIELNAETGFFNYINLKAGLFNGVGPTALENDRNKDFIGRIGFQLPMQDQNVAVDGGFSFYDGKVSNNSKYLWTIDNSSSVRQFIIDSSASNAGGNVGRVYYGADLQLYYDLPVLGGFSVRGEYIAGQQPGTQAANGFYSGGKDPTPLYVRNFTGWYVAYVQNIGTQHQFLLKYDVFDPNTDLDANDIGASGTTSSSSTIGDIRYSTLGIGWVYHWDANVKFVAYYDKVSNEKVNAAATGSLAPFTQDLNDDVFTLRMQVRF